MRLKRGLSLIFALMFIAASFSSCSKPKNGKLLVFCTLFPQYDFAREIGDSEIEPELILTPGEDYRDHQPTKADIKKYADCDIFIYTNDIIEPWVLENLDLLKSKGALIVNACEGVAFDMNLAHDDHDHDHGDDDHDHHEHTYEPHVWTNPQNAAIMAKNVADRLISADPENAGVYNQNNEKLQAQLKELDSLFGETVSQGKRKTFVMADRFTLQYFTLRYSLGYLSAISSCAESKEISDTSLNTLIDSVKKQKLEYIFYRELSDKKIALLIGEQSGAKLLLFHSCENLSQEEWNANKTYVSLMHDNISNLKTAFT